MLLEVPWSRALEGGAHAFAFAGARSGGETVRGGVPRGWAPVDQSRLR